MHAIVWLLLTGAAAGQMLGVDVEALSDNELAAANLHRRIAGRLSFFRCPRRQKVEQSFASALKVLRLESSFSDLRVVGTGCIVVRV